MRRRLALLAVAAAACGPGAPSHAPPGGAALDAVARDLDELAGGLTAGHEDTFHAILGDTLAKDPYLGLPSARDVFFGPAPEGERTIAGEMPHYGFFFGPMHYRVRRIDGRGGAAGRWEVSVTIAVDPPAAGTERLELPDCALVREVGGDASACRGTPYALAPGRDACPGSGSFSLPATPANVRALLRLWSREAERYWNRDAAALGLPVSYDFELVPADEARDPSRPPDLRVPLSPTCGRTPYFAAFRSGWSLPIVAHEIGHVLGLLDEYDALSGLTALYPKTPFPGAEVSRMGLSMKEGTKVLPLHHYLILRRYFCPEPAGGFYAAPPI